MIFGCCNEVCEALRYFTHRLHMIWIWIIRTTLAEMRLLCYSIKDWEIHTSSISDLCCANGEEQLQLLRYKPRPDFFGKRLYQCKCEFNTVASGAIADRNITINSCFGHIILQNKCELHNFIVASNIIMWNIYMKWLFYNRACAVVTVRDTIINDVPNSIEDVGVPAQTA